MPVPRKTQKQISLQYARNLLYNRVFHPLRRGRLLLGLLVMAAAIAVALWQVRSARTTPALEWFNSSGGISQAHAGFAKDCKQCHAPAGAAGSFPQLTMTAASLDSSCLKCHQQHTFHQPNVVVDHSCVACHHEHLGTGPMQPVADVNCRSCHADAGIMAASARKGEQMPAPDFHFAPAASLIVFQPPRPRAGYTKVIHSFDTDHPEFQIQRDHLADPDTLNFDHKVHLNGDIPLVNGKKLDCAYCHQPDSRGAYMLPVTFAKNCQACHSLQFDASLPNFQIPHPLPGAEAGSVRDFLLTLPTQYMLYATQHAKELHLTEPAQINAFVSRHLAALRQRNRRGDDLINDVFFADSRHVNVNGVGMASRDRAMFPGCAYCHEVKTVAGYGPRVTKPILPDRWFVHARFDHAAHTTVSCESCHSMARQSEKTADILMPAKASCVVCHSTKGGVVSTCVICHQYHNMKPATSVADMPSLREMMLEGSQETALLFARPAGSINYASPTALVSTPH